MTPSTTKVGSAWVVGRLVSKQPPWSMEMSTSTAPGFMVESMARVRSLGAVAPATSTAPTTRSASRTSRSMVAVVEYSVRSAEPNMADSSRRRSTERSTTVTSARRPMAISAAWVPATPPPRITTLAGGTPGTPPSRMPKPPLAFCRLAAPTWIDIRPATSLMGVSSGSEPLGAVTVS